MRQAAGHGIALSEGGSEIRGAKTKEFLSRIDFIAVFRSEGPRSRYTLDIGEQQAAGGERDNALDVGWPQRRA